MAEARSTTSEAGSGSEGFPQVAGYFVLPSENNVIDAGRLLGDNAKFFRRPLDGIVAHTITGGVPDASDQLPEGTIIIVA